mgnify:CR=1
SFTDPTLSDRSLANLRKNIELVIELAGQEEITVFSADNANKAAQRIHDSAA